MAISELFEALEQNPSDLQTLDAIQNACIEASDQENLERAYATVLSRLEDPKDVEGVLRRVEMKVRQVPNEELQTWMQFYVGFQYWTRLQNPDKAEMLFRKLGTDEGPYFPVLVDFYKQFYADKENWRRLEDLLMKAEGGDQDELAALRVKRYLAQLATEKDKKDKAIAFWQGVRQLDPEDDEAEAALKTLYIDVQKWHSLIELLNEKLARLGAEAVDDKIAIHLEMVAIFRDHIKSETKVNSAYQAILELQPGNEMALNALIDQFTAMKRWPDLVRVLQQKVEHTADTAALIRLHREIASIMMEKFSNSSEAIKSYAAILALDPRDREAIATLKDVYDKRRDWEHYVEISLSEVELVEDADEKHKATVALAELASERIRKPSVAIDLWARVLAHEADNRKALDHLE
jgi:tetratricopeptide (TPR) repeat protein